MALEIAVRPCCIHRATMWLLHITVFIPQMADVACTPMPRYRDKDKYGSKESTDGSSKVLHVRTG